MHEKCLYEYITKNVQFAVMCFLHRLYNIKGVMSEAQRQSQLVAPSLVGELINVNWH